MNLYPAIDIAGGRAVRLVQGRFEDETVYADSPLAAAQAWVDAGATHLHVVDLDGAKQGAPASLHHLAEIVRECRVPVQYGGGLRSAEAVRDALAAGAARVIIGTAAFRDAPFLDAVVAEHGERVTVGVDVRGGRISTAGWTEESELQAPEAIEALASRGVTSFIYTNVDRDGMLGGPDLDEVAGIAQVVPGTFQYSGGIGTAADLAALAGLGLANLTGVISGKALYERRFTVAEGQAALASPAATT